VSRDDEIRALVGELRALMERARLIVEELTARAAKEGAGTEEGTDDEP
jgi:hypothetical protein